jgi:hypothetical protein
MIASTIAITCVLEDYQEESEYATLLKLMRLAMDIFILEKIHFTMSSAKRFDQLISAADNPFLLHDGMASQT